MTAALVAVLVFLVLSSEMTYGAPSSVQVELVAEHETVAPGETITLGVLFTLPPETHLYWLNPGDSGMPPSFSIRLPAEYRAGEVQWPPPHRLEKEGEVVYGYSDQVLFPFEITVPATAVPSSSAVVRVDIQALLCSETCQPIARSLNYAITVGVSRYDERHRSIFEKTRQNLPHEAHQWQLSAHATSDNRWQISMMPPNGASVPAPLLFIPLRQGVIRDASPQYFFPGTATSAATLSVMRGYLDPGPFLEGLLLTSGTHSSGPFQGSSAISVRIPVVASQLQTPDAD